MTTGIIEFQVVENWEKAPADCPHRDVAAVATDSRTVSTCTHATAIG
jgi:hypothetical protein